MSKRPQLPPLSDAPLCCCCVRLCVCDQLLTNSELLTIMDPSDSAMPYIFEHFEWEHCRDVGVDFDNIVPGQTLDYGPN